jgi:hypothetical protein
MAQAKTIQLLRSQNLYDNIQAAKTAMNGDSIKSGRKDGEMLLARYNAGTTEQPKIQSLICIWHDATGIQPAGWTFIEDVSNNADSPAALRQLINNVITGAGLNNDGSYTAKVGDEIVNNAGSINGAVEAIIDYIKRSDKVASAENGKVITTVTQTNGRVTETKENLTDIVMAGYAADTTKTGAIAETDTLEQAFNKLENGIASATVKSTDNTVNITDNSGKDLSVNIDGTTLVKNTTSGVISSDLKILKETTGLDTNVKEQYKLVYGSSTTAIGDVIKVYKDSSLKSVALNGQNLDFTYILADGTESTVSVDVSTFLAESEFKDGLQVNNGEVSVKVGDGIEYGSEASGNKSIKVKIDTASDDAENFLSVGANGVKISGVQDAIDDAIADLDVTDTAVAGQYVSAVNETDGKVSMTRANVADAVLTGYDKGSSAPQSTAVAATDDVKTAISKLEWQVAAANAGVEALDAEVTSTDGHNVQVKVTEVNGKITAVNVTTDNTINSTDLTNAIGALDADLDASGTAAHGGTFVMSGVTEVDGKITAVDSVEVEAAGAAAAAKATIDAYTVNGKAISTNPVLGGSDVALTGYSKGADATAVSASDSVNVAIGKLENQVDAAKAAATAAHTSVEHATGNTHVTVSASQPDANGKVTYTVNETNIANADDLTTEIAARKAVDGQSGNTYTANTGTNYISDASSLNNADVKLDTALKTVDDAMLTQINGSNAIDVTTKASKQQTVSLKLDTATATGNITSDMLQITSNGLMMKDTWDCGVF